ncbi:esterase FE4-like isoform X2 [Odontomachus brunneus]|nr:esterase FE4-like isoform X2 [Odontomachus brunneus]
MMLERGSDKFAGGRSTFGSVAWCACCVLVFSIVLADGVPSGSEPIINTTWGPVRGKWSMSLNGRPIANFLGIPYALPPLGDLRFKSPQRWNRTWTTVRDGTYDRQMCTQFFRGEVLGGEDCLHLNVFMPMLLGNQLRVPVVVYVYGGMFKFGSSNSTLYAPDYLLDHDVVLVTLNYRLNALGFFSTTNQVAPGNYGLKDIVAALHWIQENIHYFGGNPESVTMMGTSSGAVLVHMLALSDKSEGLFHRYILHSGSALHPWALQSKETTRRIGLEFAWSVGCLPPGVDNATASNETIANSGQYDISADDVEQEIMKCMRDTDPGELSRMSTMYFWRMRPCCPFLPTLEEESEDAIVTMPPLQVIKNGLFRDIPAIILVTKDEGLLSSMDFILNPEIRKEMIENFEEFLPYVLEYQDVISNTSVFADAIQNFYFGGNLTEANLMRNITEMIGDATLIWPSFQTARYQSEMGNASVYLSLFAYQGTFSATFSWNSPTHYGVCHTDELNYLFPIFNNAFKDWMLHNTENDNAMITFMTEIWTNFARDGVPRAWTIPAWPDYRDHHQFMRFGLDGSPDIAVQADFLPARMEFWEKLTANVSTECDVEPDVFTDNPADNMITTIGGTAHHRLMLDVALIIALIHRLI